MKTFKGKLRIKKGWVYLRIGREFLDELEIPSDLIVTDNLHVSVVKDEVSLHKQETLASLEVKEISFEFSDKIHTNGLHNWVECFSDELCTIRETLDVPFLKDSETGEYKMTFHITLGKFKTPQEFKKSPQLRISSRTHIDVHSGRQFI